MAEVRKIIRAFLASPGDLQQEREAIRDMVKDWNETWADHLGYQIELMGWEETISGFGRPQHIINQELDRCDLFLGMMWKKWGTPPDTNGKYSSGFQEEYERSVERRKKSGKPEISLFFKEIDKEFLLDKGPDLQKVIEFHEKIISEKSILFQQFKMATDVTSIVRKCISNYVRRIREAEQDEMTEKIEIKEKSKEIPASTKSIPDISSPLSKEGFKFLEDFTITIRNSDAMESITACDIARFRLLSNSVTKNGNDSHQMGVHDLNILYANRKELKFGNTEFHNLILFGFQYIFDENTPIWYWYSKRKRSRLCPAVIFSFASDNEKEKTGAIHTITLLGTKLSALDSKIIKKDWIVGTWFSEDSSTAVKLAALNYLKLHGEISDFGIVEAEYKKNNYATSQKAFECMLSILHSAGEPVTAAALVVEKQFASVDLSLLNNVLSGFVNLNLEQLTIGLEHRSPNVRLEAFNVLNKQNKISAELAEKLINDDDPTIRYESLILLIKNGKSFENDRIKKILVKPQNNYGLLSAMGATEEDGEEYFIRFNSEKLYQLDEKTLIEKSSNSIFIDDEFYFVLSDKYFSKHSSTLRTNIDDNFESYFKEKIKKIEFIEKKLEKIDLSTGFKKAEDLFRKKLTRKGLNILCKKGKIEDSNRIRDNLKSGYTGAMRYDSYYFRKHGTWEDIQLLGNAKPLIKTETMMPSENNDEFLKEVAITIYQLGKNSLSKLFLSNLPSKILEKLIEVCSEANFNRVSDDAVLQLLKAEEIALRKKVSLLAVRSFTKNRITNILDTYLSNDDSKYYNVIHWLDAGVSLTRDESRRVVSFASAV